MSRNEESGEPEPAERRRKAPGDWLVEGYAEGETTYLADVSRDETRGPPRALFYDEREEVVFEADVEEGDGRYVPLEGTEREPGPTETLGDVLEEFGEQLHWESLSEFARNHLESDRDARGEPSLETIRFTQSNVLPDADHDVEFTGVYKYSAADGRAVDVERTFEVTFDDPDDLGEATVDVDERVMRAEDPDQDRGSGDTDVFEEREATFEVDLSDVETGRQAEAIVEERCEEWHEEVEPEPRV